MILYKRTYVCYNKSKHTFFFLGATQLEANYELPDRTAHGPVSYTHLEVDHEKYPQVKQVYRFTQVHPEEMEEESDKVEVPDLTLELDESMEPEQSAVEEEPKKMSEDQPAQEKQDVSGGIKPILLEFLDADTLEEKMHIMTFYRNQMDEALLNSIAISLDLVVDKKGLQETYDEIMNCLSMMKHFECTNRFR